MYVNLRIINPQSDNYPSLLSLAVKMLKIIDSLSEIYRNKSSIFFKIPNT